MPAKLYARQGDLIIEIVNQTLEKDVTRTVRDFSFAGDSSGHRHMLHGAALLQDLGQGVFRVQPIEDTQLEHQREEGHKTIPMKGGQVYEVRPQREDGNGLDRNVAD